GRSEVPAPPRIAEIEMGAEDAGLAVERPRRVLAMHVIDAIRECADERDRIDHLPVQVAGIEVEAEHRTMVDRLERSLGRVDIEGDLGLMDFQRELDAALLEDVQDGVPAVGEKLETFVNGGVRYGRK